jgi:hypothetical protein
VAERFVEVDAVEARLAQWHQRVLVDPAAEIADLGVANDLTREPPDVPPDRE